MANILLAYSNRASAATLSGGTWNSNLDNLKNERRVQVATSANESPASSQFVADLTANYTLRALGLTNHNLTANGQWRVVLSDAVLDVDYTGSMLRLPGSITITYSGGANGTAGSIYGTLDATSAPRVDYSATNLASGTATQTISNVPVGRYIFFCVGSGGKVQATGPGVQNSGVICTNTAVSYVDVTAVSDVTLTVLSAVTAIYLRKPLGLLVEEERTNLLDTQDFDNAYWTLVGITSSAGATAPDGSTSYRMTRAADVESVATVGESIADDTAVHTQSLFVGKDATQSAILFRLALVGGTAVAVSFFFNPITGVVTGNETPYAYRVEDKGTFWRLEISAQNNGSGNTTAALQFYMHTSGGLGYMDLWGPVLETAVNASSFIGGAVTRTADTAIITSTSFTAAHSATAGTLYAEFDVCTTVAGTRPVLSLDNNTADERIELYASGTDLKFKVVDGGSTVVDMTIGTIAANTAYKVAVAWAANDFAASLSGAAVVTDSSGTLPTLDRMRIGADQAGNRLNGHIRRFARWLTRRTNSELQTLATSGPDALGHDTGWMAAQALTFHGTEPDNWGEQYPLIAAFPATSARYAQVLIDDATNPDEEILLGSLFIGEGFQPEHNAEYGGFADGREDLSVTQYSAGGQLYAEQRAQRRKVDFNFPVLTQAEADHLDEMRAAVGTVGSVLYVPDPADAAKTQRYGFVGRFRELSPIEYPFYNTRATPFRLEEKL